MVGGILFLGAGTYFLGKSGDKKETKMDKVAQFKLLSIKTLI